MADIIDFRIGDKATTALVALPSSAPARAGVVVSFNHNGFDPSTRSIVDNLANEGFAAIAPNHYHVMPPGVGLEHRREYLSDEQLAQDFQAAYDWLVTQQKIPADRIALIGHCQGGRAAWVGATAKPDLWQAVCVWYGGGAFGRRGDLPPPYERLDNIQCPVMGFFGNDDKNPSPEDVDRFEASLKERGKSYVFHRYDGAGHAFMNFNHAHYDPLASEHSWGEAMKFLKGSLLG